MTPGLGKFLIIFGIILIVLGFAMTWNVKLPPWLGKLPGDIVVKRDNFQFFFPITTCILLSIILTLIFHLFRK